MKHLLPLSLALGLIAPFAAPAQEAPKVFKAGAATADITPWIGYSLAGGMEDRLATRIDDKLNVRAIVLDDGANQLAIAVVDCCMIDRPIIDAGKDLANGTTGIPQAHMLVSATHSHSAGTCSNVFQSSPDPAYTDLVTRRIGDAITQAYLDRVPAKIAWGSGSVPDEVFNRRWHMKEGTAPETPFGKVDPVKMNPGAGNPNLVKPAGPVDPEVSFLAFREPGGRMISLFAAYSLHYVGGVGPGHISADYYGYFCEALKKMQDGGADDPPFVAMMANGTSGDINNIDFLNPRPGKKPYEQMQFVADDVAKKVHGALSQVTWQAAAPLAARYRELEVAWRPIDEDLLKWARETEAKAPRIGDKADLPLAYAGRVQRLAKASPETKLPVQVIRIGDVCIGTTPCETFAETGLEFKERSPIAKSFLVELANGYYGYMPTPRHFELGGYETWPGTNNLESQASVKVMDALLEMAAEVKP